MKEYTTEKIRTVALVSHSGVGKTSLSEAMLFTAGVITRLGKVEEGNTVSDYTALEIERKASINLTLMHLEWKDTKINIIDTPGYADFIGEVASALRVADCAIVLVSAQDGVAIGTQQIWEWVKREKNIPMFLINRVDAERSNYRKAFEDIKKMLTADAVLLQMPYGEGANFKGIIDIVKGKCYTFSPDRKMSESDIPGELKGEYEVYRQQLVDKVAETDDALLEKYLDGAELTGDEITKGLKDGIVSGKIAPVFFAIPTLNIGTSILLDGIVEYMPSPAFRPYIMVSKEKGGEPKDKLSLDGPTTIFFFRTLTEAKLGEISFFKVYAGKLTPGTELFNSDKRGSERIGQIYVINGKEREEVPALYAGDIGATVRLKITQTNDTLCSDKNNPIFIPPIDFPSPVINMGLEVKNKGDEDKVAAGLARLHEEDPTFSFVVDPELKQTIIFGQGELQLELIVKKLKERYGVEVELTRPRIPYRETIRKKAEAQGKYKRQTGGRGQYGDCWLRLEPLPRGKGFEFVDAIVGGVIPSKFIPSIEKGVREVMESGVLTNSKVTDIKVTVFDGSYHEVDSSDIAFKIAGSLGFKNAFLQADPVILEPIYNVKVVVPEEFMGDVIGDISARRGRVLGIEPHDNFQTIIAQIPLAELYRYSTTLRSLTQGRGYHTREFSHYEEVPKEIAEKIIAEYGKKTSEE